MSPCSGRLTSMIMSTLRQFVQPSASRVEQSRDVDPENCWDEWNALRPELVGREGET